MVDQDRPNILLITTDQQRYDTAGPARPSFLRTPHLDLLTREGIWFNRAYADCPICVPARMSIMSGRSGISHGMTLNGSSSDVLLNRPTLPGLLSAAGYQSVGIGKMHFTPPRARHGFDQVVLPDDYYAWIREIGYPLRPMRHGLGQNELYPGVSTVPESLTLTSWIAEQSVQFIRERRDPTVPFFLWTSFSKPHPPLDPPEPYASMYADAPISKPFSGSWSSDKNAPEAFVRQRQRLSYDLVPPEVIHAARIAYYGLITHIDYVIGRVLSALQDVNLYNDTLILFTSDHGEFLGDHHAGGKVMFHESSARIPFILRLPKSWTERHHGTTSDALVTHADIVPTLLAAAGVSTESSSDEFDGQDLIELVHGKTRAREVLVAAAHESGTSREGPPAYLAVTDGQWKYIWYPEGPSEQFFDVVNDPTESRDLSREAAVEPHRSKMRDRLIAELQRTAPRWVTDDGLIRIPRRGDTVADRRNQAWPGLHTEYYPVDVKH